MEILIVGARERADALAARLASQGIDADTYAPHGAGAPRARIPALAASLVELERLMVAERPGLVVLADAGEHALAAVLVATKLLVPTVRIDDRDGDAAGADPGENGRLLDQLAETVPIERVPTLLRR